MPSITPEQAINSYVWEQFRLDSLKSASASYLNGFDYTKYNGIRPIFPVSDSKAGDAAWENKTYIVYDSYIPARRKHKSLYPIKSGQMLYSIKGSVSDILNWRDFIVNILDREDVAGRDISNFIGESGDTVNFRFHCLNASQQNYIGNTSEGTTAIKTYSANLIIKYDYHITNVYNNS